MFSKDPSELIRKEKMSNEEISRSIRLALAAELDAINFYLQQSSLIPEGSFKKVHEDIAKEEVTHFGEFMRLLYEYEPGDFDKIKEGWKEASELLSVENSQTKGEGVMDELENKGENNTSEEHGLAKELSHFRIIKWKSAGVPLPEDESKIVPLRRASAQFSIPKGGFELYNEEKIKENLRKFKADMCRDILLKHDLSLYKRAEKMKAGDWSKEGEILGDVIEARNKLLEAGYTSNPVLLVSTEVNRLILRQSEESGQPEIELIKEGVGEVHVSPYLTGYHVIVVNPGSFWIFLNDGQELKKISETSDSTDYSITSSYLPILYDKKAAITLEWKK